MLSIYWAIHQSPGKLRNAYKLTLSLICRHGEKMIDNIETFYIQNKRCLWFKIVYFITFLSFY